ncbi:hypothetical protein LIER_10269 [Lithospermum erythrorhizon]|uniref:Uncharacterized protein n=1 Tax=Lithospermum erythrorhizon TaxID=34254 RepID=A0AAV3PIQ6_LITER
MRKHLPSESRSGNMPCQGPGSYPRHSAFGAQGSSVSDLPSGLGEQFLSSANEETHPSGNRLNHFNVGPTRLMEGHPGLELCDTLLRAHFPNEFGEARELQSCRHNGARYVR